MEVHCIPRGGHCPQNAHKARPKSTFLGYVFVMSWLTVSFLQGGSFPVVDKYLGCTFICTSRASGRGIITMDTGYTDLSTEQTYCYQLTNQSIYRKNVLGFWLQFADEEPKSSGQQPV